jgi:hypothetical protein
VYLASCLQLSAQTDFAVLLPTLGSVHPQTPLSLDGGGWGKGEAICKFMELHMFFTIEVYEKENDTEELF